MRRKTFIFMMAAIFLVSCAKNLTTDNATSIIKSAFRLTDKDKIEILGISKESKTVTLVKFKYDDNQFNSKMRKYDKGWQLEEIQNELGLWVPATSVARLFDQSEKVKLAMTEINTICIALVDYITDNRVAPEQSGTYDKNSPIYNKLCPSYIRSFPVRDPWGNNYLIYCRSAIEGKYGIKNGASDDLLVISYGKDGKQEAWEFDQSKPEAGLFSDMDYDKDLINYDGTWIRGPRELIKRK